MQKIEFLNTTTADPYAKKVSFLPHKNKRGLLIKYTILDGILDGARLEPRTVEDANAMIKWLQNWIEAQYTTI